MRIETREGGTLAEALRAGVDGLSWNRARELCRRGKVRVNGQVELDASRRLRSEDDITFDVTAPRVRAQGLSAEAIVHLDRQLVVVNKPAGVMSVPFDDGDRDTLVDQLRVLLRQRSGAAGGELGVVQRLDKDTTGLLVFARTLSAKRHLQQQFRVHSIERRYIALVHGELHTTRTIDTQLIRDRGDGLRGSWGHFRKPRGKVPSDAQRAVTDVEPLQVLAGATLVECRLHTGRQHQIRIHLSELGHPLLGEPVYIRDYTAPRLPAPRIMLHAGVLGLTHPGDDRPLRLELGPPQDFSTVLAERGGKLLGA
jgi:23S rRNA pseudouridine1911/1915/1917 synthase